MSALDSSAQAWWDSLGDSPPAVGVPGLLPGSTLKYDIQVSCSCSGLLFGQPYRKYNVYKFTRFVVHIIIDTYVCRNVAARRMMSDPHSVCPFSAAHKEFLAS